MKEQMTTMAKHNKKRNVGLIHEQLVRHVSENIVNQDKRSANVALNILENHFSKNSELYKEFRLFNSLVHTRVSSKEIARRIIEESRLACKSHDSSALMKEKSSLIKDINHKIDNESFYDKRIEEYKIFSTVQALLNEWRGKSKLYPEEVIKYELVLENWLSRDSEEEQIRNNDDANPLVLSIMIEKFNNRYGDHLNDRQKDILSAKLSRDPDRIVECVKKIKRDGLNAVNEFYSVCDNDFLNSKKNNVLSKINGLELSSSDVVVERALSLAALIEELESDDE